MCETRLRRVVALAGASVEVVAPGGATSLVSLLAYEGPAPSIGEWIVVHSGYALAPVPPEEVRRTVALLGDAERTAARIERRERT